MKLILALCRVSISSPYEAKKLAYRQLTVTCLLVLTVNLIGEVAEEHKMGYKCIENLDNSLLEFRS